MSKAVFTKGSILRHILVMTGANTIGLVTLFTVDLIDIYFLSLLGQQELAAAVGFAGTLLFFLTALSIGLQIAMGALVSRAEGSHDRQLAGRYCSNTLIVSAMLSIVVCFVGWWFLVDLLSFLGAKGKTLQFAVAYSSIVLPSTPILAVGMCAAAALRGVGDARRSMYATLAAALVNAALDPLFIFGFNWGIEGAAAASVMARVALVIIALLSLIKVHRLPVRVSLQDLLDDIKAIFQIGGPAVLTNLATPIGASYVLKTMSSYGDSAVAGAAILGRVVPVAFAALFALSGAIGPIIGQNAGAGFYDRVRSVVYNAMLSGVVYVLAVWAVLFLLRGTVIEVFAAQGEAAYLIDMYSTWLAGGFMFSGMLFVANASFNNLNLAYAATLLNFGRTLLGVIPLVALLSHYYGAVGVLAGEIAGAGLFGIIGFITVLRYINYLEDKHMTVPAHLSLTDDNTLSGFSSEHSRLGQRCVQHDGEDDEQVDDQQIDGEAAELARRRQ